MIFPQFVQQRIEANDRIELVLPGSFFALEFYSQPLQVSFDTLGSFPARIGLQLGPVPGGFTKIIFKNESPTEANHVGFWVSEVPISLNLDLEPKTLPIPLNVALAAGTDQGFPGYYQFTGARRWRRKEILLTNYDAALYLTYQSYSFDNGSVALVLADSGLIGPKQTIRLINDHQLIVANPLANVAAVTLYAKSDYYI